MLTQKLTRDLLVNDAAIRCFRDTADQDYIAARLSYFSELLVPSLWQSQQAIEKYLKCILLLQRVPALDIGHSLLRAVEACRSIPAIHFQLTPPTEELIAHLEKVGLDRYLVISTYAEGRNLIRLDRAVWELRRYCELDPQFWSMRLEQGRRPTRYALPGGYLETVLTGRSEARKALVRQNGFWGAKSSTKVRRPEWVKTVNSPLYMHPEILSILERYIRIPSDFKKALRQHTAPDHHVPEDGTAQCG